MLPLLVHLWLSCILNRRLYILLKLPFSSENHPPIKPIADYRTLGILICPQCTVVLYVHPEFFIGLIILDVPQKSIRKLPP